MRRDDPRTVVLGLGNMLMSDDGIGLAALARLQDDWFIPPQVELVDGGTWGMNLLPIIESADRVLVLDAIDSGAAPGTLAVVTDQAEVRLATEGETKGDDARVAKELAEAEQHLAAARARLANTAFTERAPAEVVEGVRQREHELAERVARLQGLLGGPA